MNRGRQFANAFDNQLRAWNNIDLFTVDVGDAGAYGALPRLGDGSAPVTGRTRAYLDVNCAHCHQPGGPAPTDLDLRYDTLAAQMNALLAAPQNGDLGLTNPSIVAPGSKETSVLWERMRRLDGTRMPALGTNRVHDAAVDVVGRWIDDGAN
jgi:mono/diheme cytochrome c family protein